MYTAQLSCLAEIGEAWYPNVTIVLAVTVGMIVGAGVVPALVGLWEICESVGVVSCRLLYL